MKLRAIIILMLIIVALIPAYSINKILQKVLRPRESLTRLLCYLLSALLLVFAYTMVLVLLIRYFFPTA